MSMHRQGNAEITDGEESPVTATCMMESSGVGSVCSPSRESSASSSLITVS